MPREYDPLAWFYDRYWGPRYHDAARPVLERLLYASLPCGAHVLDFCCGSGHLTEELADHGYTVTGVDSSIEMLRRARRRVPRARLFCADAACVAFAHPFCAAAASTFDSINHLISLERVSAAFRAVASALRAGGVFVFDINTDEAYRSEWGKSSAIVEPDAALFVRGGYDQTTRIGRTEITTFRLHDGWQRADVSIEQRSFSGNEISGALAGAGFRDVEVMPAPDVGMQGEIAVGRVFVRARR